MIRAFVFKLLDLLVFFKKKNLQVTSVDEYTDGTMVYQYTFGAHRYYSVGATPEEPPMGLVFPLIRAESNGKDVTQLFKEYAGPKLNHVPDTGYIFFNRMPVVSLNFKRGIGIEIRWRRSKGPSTEIRATNVIGQVSVFGAK